MRDKRTIGLMIGPATTGDVPAILELIGKSGLPTDGVIDHLDTAIVARADDRVVGCAALEVYRDGALLRSVAVDSQARSRGIGHQLTRAAIEMAQQLGVPAVYLLTTTAERFFPRFGFDRIERSDVPIDVRESVEFRSACPSTAVVMRRILVGVRS
jgi:amino-acid N-acetyltransferase